MKEPVYEPLRMGDIEYAKRYAKAIKKYKKHLQQMWREGEQWRRCLLLGLILIGCDNYIDVGESENDCKGTCDGIVYNRTYERGEDGSICFSAWFVVDEITVPCEDLYLYTRTQIESYGWNCSDAHPQ